MTSIRFSKRLSIFPGVHLNVSSSGLSVNLGVPGANVTLGSAGGNTVNLGIPGSGISTRIPLDSQQRPQPDPPPRGPLNLSATPMIAIQSGSLDTLTTPPLEDLRNLLLEARAKQIAAEALVSKSSKTLVSLQAGLTELHARQAYKENKLSRLESSWFKFMRKRTIAKLKIDIAESPAKIERAKALVSRATLAKVAADEERDGYFLDTDFSLTGATHKAWVNLREKFEVLSKCSATWDITASRSKKSGQERSIATEIIDRRPTTLRVADLPILQSRYQGLCWANANGDDLYLYPGLIVIFRENDRFALLDMWQVKMNISIVQFQETETVPADAIRSGTTWTYANKNGMPDRRYSYNPEIPVVAYGRIDMVSSTGLLESFLFSAAQPVIDFMQGVLDFRIAAEHDAG